ncbi:MAG: GNAT family N-acetyltransferase [Rhodocyclaceae bacterium]|jgi:GNAT superfamily N-acetyltransferase|nr:GNAT family N-acetyltransferase [Rhodocyclaceae bacterium]
MKIVEAAFENGRIAGSEWLTRAERVHRQLRPQLPADYVGKMGRVLAGARMALAVEGDEVLGLAVYRWHENTFDSLKFYVDDLVTDESRRSRGVGHALIAHLENIARGLGAGGLVLDSGTQRTQAHKFYFREGFVITSFTFKKSFP